MDSAWSDEVENQLRARLAKAEAALRQTRLEAQLAIAEFQTLPQNPDSHHALRQTTKDEREALRAYLAALREWTRFILDGQIPDGLK